ncbi:Alpha/Beta hydrolase protein [Ephemerocybe angulata]|uniref:Alpha/Beta hydrolase protein n=1 Tax=Ephemerocybe angulata TaxID=980116 RepID=A0A8H6IIW5_9AGAR|nr:Alpha/Beta hydrolase protein [Tulosesus angulatus]
MDSLTSDYKDFATSRGLNYHYYFSAADAGKPTLLFVHGFPSISLDWYYQIIYFKAKGYGVVVPDMLGYGGTDKPEEHTAYLHSLLAKDLIDILEHEKIENVLAIGHDWGSRTTSALAQLYADHFLGFAFLSVGYIAPNTELTYEQIRARFFSAPDANEVVKGHLESFWDVLHARDPRVWKYTMCPTGGLRTFLESDSRTPRGSYVPEDLSRIHKEKFQEHGFAGALNYYKIMVNGADMEEAKKIPQEQYVVKKPVFFGGTAKDPICVPMIGAATVKQLCPQATIQVFETGHWVQLEAHEEVNEALNKWLEKVLA